MDTKERLVCVALVLVAAGCSPVTSGDTTRGAPGSIGDASIEAAPVASIESMRATRVDEENARTERAPSRLDPTPESLPPGCTGCASECRECAGTTCGASICTGTQECSGGTCITRPICTGSNCDLTTNYCSGTYCIPKVVAGGACSTATMCSTGNCVNGVCCNASNCNAVDGSSCGGSCQSGSGNCAWPTSQCVGQSCSSNTQTNAKVCNGAGSCVLANSANPAAVSCGAYGCANGTTCSAACDPSSANPCPGLSGYTCSGTTCQLTGTVSAGGSCSTTGACMSGLTCIPSTAGNDVCCKASSCPAGQACSTGGSGCVTLAGGACGAGLAPCVSTSTCVASNAGSTCCAGTGCGNFGCSAGGACLTTCSADTQCATGKVCDLKSGTCVTPVAGGGACTQDDECAGGGHCVAGSCCAVACGANQACDTTTHTTCKSVNGQKCAASADCVSGNCIDGYCCNTACGSQCQACDVTGSEGTCTPVKGAPHPNSAAGATPRAPCAGTGKCAATCDGLAADVASCGALPGQPPAAPILCSVEGCTDGFLTAQAYCDASGNCPTSSSVSCNQYACNAAGTACNTSCTVATQATDCATGDVCITGSCVPATKLGESCGGDNECASMHCVASKVGSVCCGVASCGAGAYCGDASAASPGACVNPNGNTCTESSDCASAFCVDGVCCDSACTGQCEACDVPGAGGPAGGACSSITGAPHGTRAACGSAGTGPCAALECDGSDRTKCIGYSAGPETVCSPATCTDGTATPASSCDGKGGCPTALAVPCNGYACGTSACNTTCAAPTDCASGYYCDTSDAKCKPVQATCSPDGSQSVPVDGTKPPIACSPYLCQDSTGSCYPSCTSSSQCDPKVAVCDVSTGLCTLTSTPTSASGGCSYAANDSGRNAGAEWSGFALLAMTVAVGARRRRPSRRTR